MSLAPSKNSSLARFQAWSAGPMFYAAMLFLLAIGGAMHFRERPSLNDFTHICLVITFVIYPVFLAETVVLALLGCRRWKHSLLYLVFPPLRMAARDQATRSLLWLPGLGWQMADKKLFRRMEKAFSVPMILIALAIVPLLAIELYWYEAIEQNPRLAMFVHVATGLIWFAFALEFIVMVAITDKKFRYCREHWIDLAIICLPLIAFLRAARLGRLVRLQQLARTARLYRMRGLLLRAFRALLVLEVINRIIGADPEKRLARLEEQLAEREEECAELREKITLLMKQIEQQRNERTGELSETAEPTENECSIPR